jgi:hypothetical protein
MTRFIQLPRSDDFSANAFAINFLINQISHRFHHKPLKWEYAFESSGDKSSFVTISTPEPPENLALFNKYFHYISADRWGPRLTTPLSDDEVHQGNLAKDGRYTIHYLSENANKRLPNPDIPLRKEKAGITLLRQVQSWLGEISPGTRIKPQLIKAADIGTIEFSYEKPYSLSPFFRATNVGFGLSYTLPVIAALLSLPKGGLVLLENPEAHLHPKGQSQMGCNGTRCRCRNTGDRRNS